MQLFEQPEIRDIIEKYIGSDPVKLALKLKLPREEREAVCEQIKMLQRAADKLPEHYKARCWLPQRAFEQSTNEAVAAAKFSEKGRLAFDLTCGLGVDTMALARNFEQVVSVAADSELADVVEHITHTGLARRHVVTIRAEQLNVTVYQQAQRPSSF